MPEQVFTLCEGARPGTGGRASQRGPPARRAADLVAGRRLPRGGCGACRVRLRGGRQVRPARGAGARLAHAGSKESALRVSAAGGRVSQRRGYMKCWCHAGGAARARGRAAGPRAAGVARRRLRGAAGVRSRARPRARVGASKARGPERRGLLPPRRGAPTGGGGCFCIVSRGRRWACTCICARHLQWLSTCLNIHKPAVRRPARSGRQPPRTGRGGGARARCLAARHAGAVRRRSCGPAHGASTPLTRARARKARGR